MKLNLLPTQLRLKDKFTIARDSYDAKDIVIVSMSDGEHTGYGEACEHKYYQAEVSAIMDSIEAVRTIIEAYDGLSPNELWNQLSPNFKNDPFALCALDVAAWDLYGKKMGKPLYELWNLELHQKMPTTDYTIGIDTVEKMLAKMRAFPFPTYKIKLGTDKDMDMMKAIRKATDAKLRIDANCGWTAGQAILYAFDLKELGVELVEQPLPADDWEGMKTVYKNALIPLFADEACVSENDVEKCAGHFHGINIKLMKCGGITPALRMIKKAKELGLKVMMGCMTECSIGISAIAHFLPLLDFVDMDGILLNANDPATGVTINEDGTVNFPEVNGTGVKMKAMMY